MKNSKAISSGKRVKLLGPVNLPRDTPLVIVGRKQSRSKEKHKDPWDSLGDEAIDLGVTDLAKQHDHYLYSMPKRQRGT